MIYNFNYLTRILVLIFWSVVSVQGSIATETERNTIDLSLLENDKEEVSKVLSFLELKRYSSKKYENEAKVFFEVFKDSILEVKESKTDNFVCDLGLINEINKRRMNLDLERSNSEYFKILRNYNYIDDIFLKLLLDLDKLDKNLFVQKINPLKKIEITLRNKKKFLENNNLTNLYSEFNSWPDDIKVCSLGAWYRLSNSVNFKKNKYRKTLMHFMNKEAYSKNIISFETYKKLEVLRESEILERKIFLSGYLNKVFWSKNILKPDNRREYNLPTKRKSRFAQKAVKTFSKTTYREQLYNKYNDEQIVVLANILKKASIRMGVDPTHNSSVPFIQQNITYRDENGKTVIEKDIYFLDNATDQYDYARRRMRMDIYNTNMYKSFSNVQITYEDIIMAALETGYITHEEVELALEYDDLWNKNESKLMQALKFTLRIGGTAVFYLPPPYNIIGAVGVALINAQFINKPKGEDNDNPASLFN